MTDPCSSCIDAAFAKQAMPQQHDSMKMIGTAQTRMLAMTMAAMMPPLRPARIALSAVLQDSEYGVVPAGIERLALYAAQEPADESEPVANHVHRLARHVEQDESIQHDVKLNGHIPGRSAVI